MTKNWMIIAAALLTFGCDGGKESGTTDEADADTDADADFDASVAWNAGSVDLTLTGGVSGYFGMAETGCADADNCWYGEDCIYGDLTKTYFYCHPTNENGVSLLYGGAFDALSEGTETVFGGASFDGTVTYYVEQGSACYTWGHDTSYYGSLDCTEL
ncbi:MAG: hypothetical protein P8R54_16105 [Myxococcota bacterium]|nr:hypothetical protein [Myxococcota bacterium]